MSGTDSFSARQLDQLEALLRRESGIDLLAELALSIAGPKATTTPIATAAICLDTNILLKLASHPKREAIVDYFLVKHQAPLVISAQSLQEFWNSQLAGVETIASSVGRKFADLKKELEKVGEEFGDYAARFEVLVDEFRDDYGHLHDQGARRNFLALVDMLGKRARLAEVPRQRFYDFVIQRQRTRTPPGFKDTGDGDFYVWLDFLFGLALEREGGCTFDCAVLVTDDKKSDWSRGGAVHPTLAAEARAFLSVPLETWSLAKLAESVEPAESK